MEAQFRSREAVERRIRDAFAGVILGNGISLRQAQVIDNYGEGVTEIEFARIPLSEETQHWNRVTPEELESDNVAHLDPEGFRFYLPAFLISLLDGYDAASMRVIGTLSALYPKEHVREYHMPRFDLLTYEQKQAVAVFLDALPSLVPLDGEDGTIVERAMRYWRQFLPIVPVPQGRREA